MWKLIFNNIWSHRRRNVWLLLEVFVATLVAWYVLDPLIVTLYMRSFEPGYDKERLVLVEMSQLKPAAASYSEEKATPEGMTESIGRLLTYVRSLDGVEAATVVNSLRPESQSSSSQSLPEADGQFMVYNYIPGTDFFKTYGLRDTYGNPFEESVVGPNDVIVSESVGRLIFGDEKVIGRNLFEKATEGSRPEFVIAGVVNDVVARSTLGPAPCVYFPMNPANKMRDDMTLLIKVSGRMPVSKFINELRGKYLSGIKAGNLYGVKVVAYTDYSDDIIADDTRLLKAMVALAAFFFINLCLGIAGSFYMQARKRREEGGVMRVFGATRGYIIRIMMGEGWVIATVASLCASVCAWIYASQEGLKDSGWMRNSQAIRDALPMWVDDFSTHFCIIALTVYVTMLLLVWIGIYIPARRISSVSPAETLHNE